MIPDGTPVIKDKNSAGTDGSKYVANFSCPGQWKDDPVCVVRMQHKNRIIT